MHHERLARLLSTYRGDSQQPLRRRVLVVEDDSALLHALTALLEETGYHVITARNGRAALERYRAEGADLIVTDYLMPEMNGGDLIRALNAAAGEPPPVVLMSSLEERIVAHACPGYASFFRKPFEVNAFLATLKSLATPAPPPHHLRLVK